MPDKRQERRHRRRLQVRYGTDGLSKIGFTEDISEEGVCLRTALVFPPLSHIRMELAVSENEIIRCEGKVRWAKRVPPNLIHKINKAGMGVQITRFEEGEDIFRRICLEMHTRF